MSRETKSSRNRVKSSLSTIGNSGALNTSKEFETNKSSELIPGKVKFALLVAGTYGTSLELQSKKLDKMKENLRKWEKRYSLSKSSNSGSKTTAGDAFSDTFNRIMMELKQDELMKKEKRLEKRKANHQKRCQSITGMFQGIGRMADTTTRKSAYETMSGKKSDLDIPIDTFDNTVMDVPSMG